MLLTPAVLAAPTSAAAGSSLLPQQSIDTQATSLWVNRTACKNYDPEEPLAKLAADAPNVVIFGIGDSGTRGVRTLYHAGGVAMCDNTNGADDDWATRESDNCIDHLLTANSGKMSIESYRQAPDHAFARAVIAERYGANQSHYCAARADHVTRAAPWGFKGPRKIYMLPVMQEAWKASKKQTQLVLVARDPRDICSGDNQQQFKATKLHYGIRGNDATACLEWWAAIWSNVLPELGGEAHAPSASLAPSQLVVVRIEDLVLPGVKALPLAECMLHGASVPSPSREGLATTLHEMHKHSGSYGGGLDHVGGDTVLRANVVAAAAKSEAAQRVMELLGYTSPRYGTTTPTSDRVLRATGNKCNAINL
eukprot:Transcript_13242.p1 GENE.Transcript_13242~~Transcript_13242.p1  ORF type:complete len:366 (-),score=43.33 Transcript_13242:218-1315(-)